MRRVEFLSEDKKLVGVFHPMKGEKKKAHASSRATDSIAIKIARSISR
jgi:hypothetical protein